MQRIAIVGAGPAGASAGYHLAARGFAVTLIDRAGFPRDKVCGDWLPHAAVVELARLGLDVMRLPGVTAVRATALFAPSGAGTRAMLRQPACCVARRVLDAAVRQRALDAGCTPLQRDVRLPPPRAPDSWLEDYDIVIDARGAHAAAANAIGLRTYWHVAQRAVSADDLATVSILTDEAYPRGYGWVFPVDRDAGTVRFNVGVGMLRADAHPGYTVAGFLARFEAGAPLLRRLAPSLVRRERAIGYHVGLGGWRSAAGDTHALRIGDAANLADPLTGDGIGNALRSGYLVAEAIAASTGAADALQRWQRLHQRHFAPELRTALALRGLLSPTLAKNAAARLLAGSALARERVHAMLFGEMPYRGLLRARGADLAA